VNVSVVIPLFDGARFLAQAVESVLAQAAPVSEIIVVDDGSSDGGPAVARSFPGVVFEARAHGGQGAALNHGVQRSRGELLAFLDQDDVWMPRKQELQLSAMRAGSVDAVVGHAEQFFEGSDAPGQVLPARLVSALLVRREAWERVGPFRPELGLGMQLEWFARAEARGVSPLMLADVVYRRRIHGANYGLRSDADRRDYARAAKAALDERRRRAREPGR
jgi:glycosyltransferase involved in cell wall biosynthesis